MRPFAATRGKDFDTSPRPSPFEAEREETTRPVRLGAMHGFRKGVRSLREAGVGLGQGISCLQLAVSCRSEGTVGLAEAGNCLSKAIDWLWKASNSLSDGIHCLWEGENRRMNEEL